MELKPGYKKTEVGVIPDDWEVKSIGQLFQLINGCAFSPNDWKKNGVPIIRIQNLNDPLAQFNYSQAPVSDKNRVEVGDLLFAWSGTIGTSFGARVWSGPSGVLNQHIFKVLMNHKKISHSIALIVFSKIEADIAKQAHGFKASFVHVKKSDLIKVYLPVPSVEEQAAIATALGDMDALLKSLDRLIAKKRDIKQAAMQQLLTGKTRLPGFEGEWEVGCLRDVVVSLDAGVSVNSIESGQDDVDVKVLKTSSVVNGKFIPSESKPIADFDIQRAKTTPIKNTLLISRMNTPNLVGEVAYVDVDYPRLFLPDRLWMTRFLSEKSGVAIWLSYLLSTWQYKLMIRATATGTSGSMKNISKSSLLRLPIRFPSDEEQTAIAAVLSDMDAEISALEKRRAKTADIKQAMMQELLTGKTRLIT